jgi:hypothetical protein
MRRFLLSAVFLSGCALPSPPPESPCISTAECSLGTVCEQGACVSEPIDAMVGTVRCEVTRGVVSKTPGYSDVLGTVAGKRIVLSGGSWCDISSDGKQLAVTLITSVTQGGTDYGLVALLMTDDLTIKPATVWETLPEKGSAVLEAQTGSTTTALAFSKGGGTVIFDNTPTAGASLTFHLRVDLAAARNGTIYGVPCPNGLADCTNELKDALTGGAICFTDKTKASICTALCSTNADCASGGGTCQVSSGGAGMCVGR